MVMSLAVIVGAGLSVYWFFSSGKATRLVTKTTYGLKKGVGSLGFTLQHIIVDGRIRTKSKALMQSLGIKKDQYIYDVDLSKVLERVQGLPWVHSVRLERRLPDTLFVKLIEKHPVAFWQHKKKHYLVDTYGTLIGEFSLKDYPGYIVATGEGAPEKLPWLIQKIGAYESAYAKVTGVVFVSQRRWNLILNNVVILKLPEEGIEGALEHIAEMDRENRLSSPEVDTVDLRSPGKVYFYLSKAGLKRRKKHRGKAA